jgi:hypothetical protein
VPLDGQNEPRSRPPSASWLSRSRAERAALLNERAALLEQADIEWQRFSSLPGRHLCLRKSGLSSWEYVDESSGAVEPRCHWTGIFGSFPTSVSYQGENYKWRVVEKRFDASARVSDLFNTSTKSSVLRRSGVHVNHFAGTGISVAGAEFSFPVRGQARSAVMSAIDKSGNNLIEYRSIIRESMLTTEIVIGPNASTIPYVYLLVAVSSRLIFNFFDSGGGGGT